MNDVFQRVRDHYKEALDFFPEERIVGIFLQGSQNYGLQTPNSDVDTKLIIVPSFKEIAFNSKPVSTTHIRENDEHIDFKDVRLYLAIFLKQNINFLEILCTPYFIINPLYIDEWTRLIKNRESIAHYNYYQAVKAMRGMAQEKFKAMEHHYPKRMEIINQFGYDPKQLHHLLRIEDFLSRYLKGESFESCLHPTDVNYLLSVKEGIYSLEEARVMAKKSLENINEISKDITKNSKWDKNDYEVEKLLQEIQYSIMRAAILRELEKESKSV